MDINAKPVDIQEVQQLVTGLGSTPPESLEVDPPLQQPLSLSRYFQRQTETIKGVPTTPVYAEEVGDSLLSQATSEQALAKSQLSNLGTKTPQDRSRIGANWGARTGLNTTGTVGAIVGAGVGAMAARALGVIQTGEHEDNVRKDRMFNTLQTMGVIGKEGTIDFEDLGRSPLLSNDPSLRLANVNSFGEGKDRSLYETDSSNPFVNRASTVARPLGLYLSQGVLGYRDRKNPRDEQAAKNAVSLLVNSITSGTDSVDVVYGRARKLVGKYGLDEHKMRSYFSANKDMFNPEEAESIRSGLDMLFKEAK